MNGPALYVDALIFLPTLLPLACRTREALVLCNSIGCPGGFTPIDEAWLTECSGGDCTVDQCCEAFCSYYACPDNYIPVVDAANIQCDSDCNTDQCCMYNGP